MSRPTPFPGSVEGTKTGYDPINLTPDVDDLWRDHGFTVDGTTSPNPIPDLKEPADITTVAYGASWTLDHDVAADWHSRIREWNGYGTHADRGLTGSFSQDVMEAVCGSYDNGTVRFWTPGDADIVFLQSGIGLDQIYDSADGRSEVNAYDNLTMMLAVLEGGPRTEITSGGTGGTWANSSAGYWLSGGAGSALGTGTWRFATTEGATIPITFDGPAVDIAIGTFNGTDNGLAADTFGRPCIVSVDGVEHSTWPTDGRVCLEADRDVGHRMVRLRNLGSGSHTVDLEAGAHAQAGAFHAPDFWVQPLASPPIVVVLKEMWLSDYAASQGAIQADYDAAMAGFDDAIADHLALNPQSRLVVADLSDGFPHPAYLGADDLHPTQAGHDWMARVALAAMLKVGPAVFA